MKSQIPFKVKEKNESARKSGRANKGKNSRFVNEQTMLKSIISISEYLLLEFIRVARIIIWRMIHAVIYIIIPHELYPT